MYSTNFRSMFVLIVIVGFSLPANALSKKEFINRAGIMMMAPCTNDRYLSCIHVKQSACKQAVRRAGQQCSQHVPEPVKKSEGGHIMQILGRCMSNHIFDSLKLTPKKIQHCRGYLSKTAPE